VRYSQQLRLRGDCNCAVAVTAGVDNFSRKGWESGSALTPAILMRSADRAAAVNNELPDRVSTGIHK